MQTMAEKGTELNVGAAGETSVPLDQAWASLQQGWTLVQDVGTVDPNLRSKVGTELNEDVEDGVSYISILRENDDGPKVSVKEVVVQLKGEKVQEQFRSGVTSDWIMGDPVLVVNKPLTDEVLKLVTLKMQPCYKYEGGGRYAVKVELLDLIWDGNMAKNDNDERGFFIDVLEIRLIPVWEGDDRHPTSFFPVQPNESTQFQRGKQTNAGVRVGPKPTATLTFGTSSSGISSSPIWTTEWMRSPVDGSATFKWMMNLWCPGSGARRILYNTKSPVTGEWSGRVPKLPPGYQGGNFTGLATPAPSAVWTVQASTFENKKVCWKSEISLRASRVMKGVWWGRKHESKHLQIKLDGLICLTPATSGNLVSWIVDQLKRDTDYTRRVIMFLIPVLMAAAGASWLLHEGVLW